MQPQQGPGEDTVMVVAGEASADSHAAEMVAQLKKLRPGLSVYGVGGAALKAQGAELLLDFSRAGVVGITEVIPELSKFHRAYRTLLDSIPERMPTGVVLLDLPDFNLILARKIKKRWPDMKIIYYISPQVWGWRPGRVKKIAKRTDAMLVLFPFEKEIYQAVGMDVEFVGHPLKDRVRASRPRDELRRELGMEESKPVIALLPGSRRAELDVYLPGMAEFTLMLKGEKPGAGFLLALAPTLEPSEVEKRLGRARPGVRIVEGRAYDVLAASDLAVVASGTATLEAAIMGTPMVVAGAVSWITYLLAKPFVPLEHISLPNVVSGKEIVPELVQYRFTPGNLLENVLSILEQPEKKARMKEELEKVGRALGPPGASRRAAEAVYKRLWPGPGDVKENGQ